MSGVIDDYITGNCSRDRVKESHKIAVGNAVLYSKKIAPWKDDMRCEDTRSIAICN